jgi:hypothetical protein
MIYPDSIPLHRPNHMNIVIAALLSLLPRKYRSFFTPYEIPASGAALSGILEMFTGVVLLISGYAMYTKAQLALVPVSTLTRAAEQGGESAIMGVGSIFLVAYLLQPLTLALSLLSLEGAFRAIAAVATSEPAPSFPFYIISLLHTRLGFWRAESQMGKRIPDSIQNVDPELLQISSCRPKSWNRFTTISYNDVLYDLDNAKKGTSPRQFVYLLRKKPLSGVVRGLHYYSPDEVLIRNTR